MEIPIPEMSTILEVELIIRIRIPIAAVVTKSMECLLLFLDWLLFRNSDPCPNIFMNSPWFRLRPNRKTIGKLNFRINSNSIFDQYLTTFKIIHSYFFSSINVPEFWFEYLSRLMNLRFCLISIVQNSIDPCSTKIP